MSTQHRDYCLWVRDGGRSICTCWPESNYERAALKETTLNEIGLALARNHEFIADVLGSLENRTMENQSWLSGMLLGWQSRIDNQHKELLHQFEILVSCQTAPTLERLRHIENKIDSLVEALDRIETEGIAEHNQNRATLNVICEHQLKIEERMKERFDKIISALIEAQPETHFKPVRHTTKKGKRR